MSTPLLLVLLAAVPAEGQTREVRRGDQMQAYDASRDGRVLPPREVERRVVPGMHGAQYLGFELDFDTAVYTLTFLRDGQVIWVDVDGRSGQVVGRTGR